MLAGTLAFRGTAVLFGFLAFMFVVGAVFALVVDAASVGIEETLQFAAGLFVVVSIAVKAWSGPNHAEELPDGSVELRLEGSSGTISKRVIPRSKLAGSLALRLRLRDRHALELDLGEDSPEHRGPDDPPHATWRHVAELPSVADGGAGGAYRSSTVARPRTRQDAARAGALRRTANIATTVVDEAVMDEAWLDVREGRDLGRMDLALLREERERGADGAVTFVFGKATRVVFVDEDNEVVRALRERLASRQDDEEVGRSRRPGTSRGGVA